RYGFVANF
nr:Chain C, RNA-directed RNA polymerase catalytic subunit [Influenza A virus H3N2]4F7T_F Chain F, RNA-directed RNA polymerase catalytic subunit [Influenza A virus H3N2]7WT4_C Chain C, PB1 peptide [Influenza A virus]7WT4_F Chain F, PB1 peptide [Influenza A virus]